MDAVVPVLRAACGAASLCVLAFLVWSIVRQTRRPSGASTGKHGSWLRSPLFYVAASAFFFGVCFLIWIPLPGSPFASWIAVVGSVLCLPGLGLVFWGRLALGRMYFVSTGFGAQLFDGHRLITSGPYALVRHPMYCGLILAAVGSLPLYQTWTTVFLIASSFGVIRRALREEEVLAGAFGQDWIEYCRRVPMIVPRRLGRTGRRGPALGPGTRPHD